MNNLRSILTTLALSMLLSCSKEEEPIMNENLYYYFEATMGNKALHTHSFLDLGTRLHSGVEGLVYGRNDSSFFEIKVYVQDKQGRTGNTDLTFTFSKPGLKLDSVYSLHLGPNNYMDVYLGNGSNLKTRYFFIESMPVQAWITSFGRDPVYGKSIVGGFKGTMTSSGADLLPINALFQLHTN